MSELSTLQLAQWLLTNCQPATSNQNETEQRSIQVTLNSSGNVDPPLPATSVLTSVFTDSPQKNKRRPGPRGNLFSNSVVECASVDFIYPNYKICVCIDVGKAAVTLRDGTPPFVSLVQVESDCCIIRTYPSPPPSPPPSPSSPSPPPPPPPLHPPNTFLGLTRHCDTC